MNIIINMASLRKGVFSLIAFPSYQAWLIMTPHVFYLSPSFYIKCYVRDTMVPNFKVIPHSQAKLRDAKYVQLKKPFL